MPRMTGRGLRWTAVVIVLVGIMRLTPVFGADVPPPPPPGDVSRSGAVAQRDGLRVAQNLSTRAPLKPGALAILMRTFRRKPSAGWRYKMGYLVKNSPRRCRGMKRHSMRRLRSTIRGSALIVRCSTSTNGSTGVS